MPASKRSKATAKSIADKKAVEKNYRRSIAQYPTPADGVDMVDAIPSWTEPVPASGNWDEVRFGC
jgi:serine/arginine repetitive matrix protein 1